MGDLISRSRVIENIWDVFNSYANDSQRFDEYETEAINKAFGVLLKMVENMSCAYDVAKVVAELEEYIEYDTFDYHKEDPLINMSFEKLEDIIRNGGKE